MDSIFSSNILVKFFGELSSSENGLGHLVEELRVWERSAPPSRVETLNALIISLKTMDEPVFAKDVVTILRNGLPTEMNNLLSHLEEVAQKNLGCLSRVPLLSWQKYGPNSPVEVAMTEVPIVPFTPLATSSGASVENKEKDSMTRQTLDKLKQKIVHASTNISRRK